MFEEATLYHQSEIPVTHADHSHHAHQLAAFEALRYWHPRHQIWIRQWLAAGLVKRGQSNCNKNWVLYTEYQDKLGNNTYTQNSFNQLKDALKYAESDILLTQLPGY